LQVPSSARSWSVTEQASPAFFEAQAAIASGGGLCGPPEGDGSGPPPGPPPGE
jgi:hypothetical protein